MKERILGYDVREMWYEDRWDLIKRGRFRKMASIEGSLWGSIFDQGACPDLAGRERERCGLGTLELPEMLTVGVNRPLWNNLGAMLNYVQGHARRAGKLYWVVAVTIALDDPERQLRQREEWPYYCRAVPDTLQEDWGLVGYDVTSRYSESMISAQLGPSLERGDACAFEENLNEYFLFSQIAAAAEFRSVRDAANESESPHMIYGIWKAREVRY